ncbi:MAG: hypothetical protein H6738_00155 [Alphaproteobacteria bacterium]|nr:hypothetical protein [Alphaproteobacteria bacterium]MCB9695178.1 hypothetical protein [Alphaproteobacteria bacterium]
MIRGTLAMLVGLAAVAVGAEPTTPPAEPSTAMGSHGSDAACGHCHDDPHANTVGDRCQQCHTTEAWSPSLFTVTDHASTAFPLEGKHATASCTLCHPNAKLVGQPTTCSGCHLDRHRGKLGDQCSECHSTSGFKPVEGFDHAGKTGFALTGPHDGPACADCHTGARGRALLVTLEPSCETCHASPHGDLGAPCDTCHTDGTFASARKSFDHRTTAFALERRHSALPCASCHPAGQVAQTTPTDCGGCHVDPHAGQLSVVCADCHRPDRWRLVRFDHDASMWSLRGKHFATPCVSCHTNQRWIGLPTSCWGCHANDLARAPSWVPAHANPAAECADCHGTWTW